MVDEVLYETPQITVTERIVTVGATTYPISKLTGTRFDIVKAFLDIPKTAIGQPLHLDGKIVADLVGAAIADTKSFMIAVDDWIEQN